MTADLDSRLAAFWDDITALTRTVEALMLDRVQTKVGQPIATIRIEAWEDPEHREFAILDATTTDGTLIDRDTVLTAITGTDDVDDAIDTLADGTDDALEFLHWRAAQLCSPKGIYTIDSSRPSPLAG